MKRVFAIVFAFILCVALGMPAISAAPKVNNTGYRAIATPRQSAPARQSSGSPSRNSSSTSSRNSSSSRTSTPSRNTSTASRGTSTASRNASTASKNTSFTNGGVSLALGTRPTTTQSRNTTTPTPQRNATPQRTTPQNTERKRHPAKVPTTPVRQQTSVKPTPEPMRKVEPLKSAPPLIKKRPVVIRARPHHRRPFVSVSGTVVYIDARSSRVISPYEIAQILHGDIMIVANPALADFRVDVTDSRAQAHATPRVTERTVPGRGEWRFVTSPPCDYRIYITKNTPDIRVYLLDETGVNHVILE